MPKPHPPLLKYNRTNLKRVSRSITNNLTTDLLPKKYRVENAENPMFGHCHTASGCLYKVFGSDALHMFRAVDRREIWHWWVEDRDKNVIDLTANQYPSSVVGKLYKKGEKSAMLGFAYRKRVLELLSRVRRDLNF
jgi:hypothetical protein